MVEHDGIFIGLGSNLGDRERHIRDALRELEEQGDIRVVAVSELHETEPVGGAPGQPRYLNGAAELATRLGPHELLRRMHAVEDRHGRVREVVNGPRTLDLDLLIHRDQLIDEPELSVPHPRMWKRVFVLLPLAEVCDLPRLAAARRLALSAQTEACDDVRRHSGTREALA